MATHRNRRLRKKLHLAEFAEQGFEVNFGVTDQHHEIKLMMRLSAAVLQPNRMSFFYEGDGQGDGRFFISGLDSSLSNDEREYVDSWVKQQPDLPAPEVGPLVDAWHPPRGERRLSGRRTIVMVIMGGKTKQCRTGIGRGRYPT
jgi:hypothetical protein